MLRVVKCGQGNAVFGQAFGENPFMPVVASVPRPVFVLLALGLCS